MRFNLRGRRSIWWGSRLTLLAPRILNDVSYVTRINHEIHFAWQAQYLVKVEGDSCCSAHSKWRFICEADQSWDALCVAGAVFGEVGVWLFVAGAAFGDILGDSRSAKCCIFQYKIVFEVRLSPKMSPNAAPATKSHTPTSPNTAPGTKNALSSSLLYSLLASILPWHLFSLGIYSL